MQHRRAYALCNSWREKRIWVTYQSKYSPLLSWIQDTQLMPHKPLPYKEPASITSKLAWTVELVKPNSYGSPRRLFCCTPEDKFIFRSNCRLFCIAICDMLPVLVNMQLAQATSLQDCTVGNRHILNAHVRSVPFLQNWQSKQEVGERRSTSYTQLWPEVTKGEKQARKRTSSSNLSRCRLMCQMNGNQTVQRWMPHDCRLREERTTQGHSSSAVI